MGGGPFVGYDFGLFTSLIAAVGFLMFAQGAWVLLQDRMDRVHVSYFAMTTCFSLLVLFMAFGIAAPDLAATAAWDKLGWALTCLVPALVMNFETAHLELTFWRRWVGPAFLVSAAFAAFLPGDLFVDWSEPYRYSWGAFGKMSYAGYAFVAWSNALMLALLWAHRRKSRQRDLSKRERKMYQLTFAAFVVGWFAQLDYLGYMGVAFPPFSSIFFCTWIFAYAYAILRYKLFALTTDAAAPAIVASMPGALFVTGFDGDIVITNPYAAKLTRVAPQDVRDHDIKKFLPAAGRILELARRDGVIGPIASEEESVLRSADGTEHPIALSAMSVRDESGHPKGVTFVAVSLEKLKEQVATIERQNLALERAMAEMEKVQKALVGRELKMVELKREVARLKE